MQPYTLPQVDDLDNRLKAVAGMTDSRRKTYRSGYRRILRDLHPEECFDGVTLNDYRLSMKLGTRNVFDVTWKHLRAFEAERGFELVTSTHLSRVRFSHPLMHDVLTLTGYLGIDQIASATWSTVPTWAPNDQVERALERIFESQTRRPSAEAHAGTPMIPTRHGHPMQPWQIEHLLNGPHHESDHPVDRGARRLSEALVHAGVNGLVLREYLTLYRHARPSLARGDSAEKLDMLLDWVHRKAFTNLRTWLIDRQPATVDPSDACW